MLANATDGLAEVTELSRTGGRATGPTIAETSTTFSEQAPRPPTCCSPTTPAPATRARSRSSLDFTARSMETLTQLEGLVPRRRPATSSCYAAQVLGAHRRRRPAGLPRLQRAASTRSEDPRRRGRLHRRRPGDRRDRQSGAQADQGTKRKKDRGLTVPTGDGGTLPPGSAKWPARHQTCCPSVCMSCVNVVPRHRTAKVVPVSTAWATATVRANWSPAPVRVSYCS